MRARRSRLISICLFWLGSIFLATAAAAGTAKVRDVRLWSGPEGTRLVVELTAPVEYDVFAIDSPDRVVIDLANTSLPSGKSMPAGQGPVKSVRHGPQPGHGLRLVLDLDSPQPPKSFIVGPEGDAGHRLVVELPGKATAVVAASPTARPAGTAPSGTDVLAMAADTARTIAAPVAPVPTPRVNEPVLPTPPGSLAVASVAAILTAGVPEPEPRT